MLFICIKYIIYILLFWSQITPAPTLESNDITTILPHVFDTTHHKDVLIIYDIDNTLVHVADGFGGDEWFNAMIQKCIQSGDTIHMALQYTLPLYFTIQNAIWLDLIQSETPRMISLLQDAGVRMMALTSRSIHIKNRTYAQLNHVGINFIHTAPHNGTLTFDPHCEACYEHGILYSAAHNKGEMLLHFFDAIEFYPKKIIFIDDKLKYIEQVEMALRDVNISCITMRYSRLDQKIKEYNLADHEKRLAHYFPLKNILS